VPHLESSPTDFRLAFRVRDRELVIDEIQHRNIGARSGLERPNFVRHAEPLRASGSRATNNFRNAHSQMQAYEKKNGKKPDWFTTHGDVFPVGQSKMTPFPPVAPNSSRSFPRKNLSKGIKEWNHYYVRAINGEVRLWVNGEEVSGGTGCEPRTGFLCLESEGAPVEFKQLRIRVLP
jgi:hypothetical protein